jgi:hypothetical protein
MDKYIEKYDTLEKVMIFTFRLGEGGIGDFVKFFTFLLYQCIQRDIKLYCANQSHISKYITMKYPKMCIDLQTVPIPIYHLDELDHLTPGISYTCDVGVMYPIFPFGQPLPNIDLDFPYDQVFEFSEEVKQNQSIILKPTGPYTSIHLRLGDHFLETDHLFVLCHQDERRFDPTLIDDVIRNTPGPILFFCDNRSYKEQIQQTHANVTLTTGEIGHTSLSNTTEKQILDTVTEFYIMTKSEHIISCSSSGFCIMASRFHRKPITYLY